MVSTLLSYFLGEKCDVRLEVFLETDLEKLYDILVLHLVGGKDMFITVSAECQRSSFTASISTLVRIPVPILHLTTEQYKNAVRIFLSLYHQFFFSIYNVIQLNQHSPVLYSIPREIWLLVDHLYRHGLKTRDLFETSALHEELIKVRDWLDYGSLDPLSILLHSF